jgi:hypothetical protein
MSLSKVPACRQCKGKNRLEEGDTKKRELLKNPTKIE